MPYLAILREIAPAGHDMMADTAVKSLHKAPSQLSEAEKRLLEKRCDQVAQKGRSQNLGGMPLNAPFGSSGIYTDSSLYMDVKCRLAHQASPL